MKNLTLKNIIFYSIIFFVSFESYSQTTSPIDVTNDVIKNSVNQTYLPSTLKRPPEYITDLNQHRKIVVDQNNEYIAMFLKYIKIEVKTTVGAESGERDLVDITQSYAGLTLGDDIDHIRKNPRSYDNDRKFFIGLDVKVSSIPIVLEKSVRDTIHEETYEKVRQGAMAAAAIQVTQGFESNVYPQVLDQTLTEAEYQAMLYKNIEEVQMAVGNNRELIEGVLAVPHIKDQDKKLKQAKKETIFQQVSLKFAWRPDFHKNHNIIIFGSTGKDRVQGHMEGGIRNLIGLEGLSNANSTQGTGVVHIGITGAITQESKVTFESWVFHNRAPFTGGRPLLYNNSLMSEEDFENRKKLFRPDSNLQKLTFEFPSIFNKGGENKKDKAYASIGNFKGNRTFSGGAIFRITPRISVQLEGTTGRDDYAKHSFMQAIMFEATDNLNLYAMNENARGLKNKYLADDPTESSDVDKASIGLSYILLKGNFHSRVRYSLTVNGSISYHYDGRNLYRLANDNSLGFNVDAQVRVEFD